MPARQKQSFLHGALILTAAAVVVKIIGALFKIPLTLVLGAEGSAHFYTAYDIFNPISSIAIAGLPIAVSKLVSEYAARGQYRDVKRIRRLSTLLFCITGTVGFAVTFVFAGPFARLVGNPSGQLPIMAIAPAVLSLCLMSAYRGYYEGLRNMYPTAVSQVVEAVVKLLFGYGLSLLVMNAGLEEFRTKSSVFGHAVRSAAEAHTAVLPYAAAGAIAGVMLSTVFGLVYLMLRRLLKGDGVTKQEIAQSPPARPAKALIKSLIRVAVPVCLGSMVVSLTATIDLASIMNRLSVAVENDLPTVMAMFSGMIPDEITAERLPSFLFGTYKGLPMTIFHLVPAITTAFGISALPAVSSAWARRDTADLARNAQSALRVTALVSIPAGLGMSALAGPILTLLYNFSGDGLAGEVQISTPILALMGIGVIFVALASPLGAVLQAIGRADLPVKFMLAGGVLKLTSNYLLVAIPSVNIMGAPVGTLLCYLFIAVASVAAVCRLTGISLDFVSVFLKPLAAGAICAAGAYASYGLLARFVDSRLSTVLAIACAGLIYLFALFLMKAINAQDVRMLPGGEKIAKVLENHGIIG